MDREVRQIVQIVPGLAPKVDGIGDYALQLARQLRRRHGIETKFLVADPAWSAGESVPEFAATNLSSRSSENFLEALRKILAAEDKTQLLVHVSPYGFEKRGAPFWLAEALERCSQTLTPNINLCFHELERTGAPPWSSGFWLPPFQRSILRRIAAVGMFRFTNTELHRRRLEAMGVGRIALIPNFSTIMEPLTVKPYHDRRRDLVIFARDTHRRKAYLHGKEVIQVLCHQLGIERIIDIGTPLGEGAVTHIGNTPVLACGRLPEADVSEWMSSSIGNFVWYPMPYLTKSSVHAVAAAHGTLNFVYDDAKKEVSCPGLETGVDFIPVHQQSTRLGELPLAELSVRSYSNYERRASWTAADTLAENLFGVLSGTYRLRR
jgi:hypothetical protein